MHIKLWIFSLIISLLLSSAGTATEEKYFPEPGTNFGVFYYPEHWPEEQWERDIKRVADLGFDFIHYNEFAWARLEPTEGNFDFSWLDKVIALADENGLKVILCTPSPCPPAWLAEKHPEILAMDANGDRLQHSGSRLTGSLANPIYQQYVERIVTLLAERYAQDDRIWGWQIGNEPHIQVGEDYSPSALHAFRDWLREKYGTIEALNEAWGAAFWSYSLNDFDQVTVPTSNPHVYLDFQTYTSEEIARDLTDQAEIIRAHGDGSQWITTNYAYFKGLKNVEPFLTRDTLDFASHTMYISHNISEDAGDSLSHRLGAGMEFSMGAEIAASVSGYTGIMELQPGQINWGRFNAIPLPGAVRMWVWHAFGMGERFVCTYRFRQPLYGLEQFHSGIMQTDGVSVNFNGKDFVQAVNEINAFEDRLDPDATDPFVEKTRTGYLWSQRNVMDIERYPHNRAWDTWQHLYTWYQGLKRMAVDVVFLQPGDTFDPEKTPFLVVPSYQMMSRELIAKLQDYAEQGGHLIMTTRSGLKDDRGFLWEAKKQEPVWPLVGGEIPFYDHLPAEHPGMVAFEGEAYPWHLWGTLVEPYPGTEVWGTFADQFYEGSAAMTHRAFGKGSSTYVGTWSEDWEMEYDVLRKLYSRYVGELPFDLPPYVFADFRDGFWVGVNYTDQVYRLPASKQAEFEFGGRDLEPGGVSVWRD
jgi:beta-galactosidase